MSEFRARTSLASVLVALIGLSACGSSDSSDTNQTALDPGVGGTQRGGLGGADSSVGGSGRALGGLGGGVGTGFGGMSSLGGAAPIGGGPAVGGASAFGGATAAGGATMVGGATGFGGNSSIGGATNAGGMTAAGGATGTTGGGTSLGGQTGVGGLNDSGGATSVGGETGSGGASIENCTFTVNSSISPKIATVGIVEWSTSLAGLQSAQIDFGLSTSYGQTATVDLAQGSSNFRTLLLGMKAQSQVHFRIVANGAGTQCASDDYTLTTGGLATGLPNATTNTHNAQALAGGYKVTSRFQGGPAFILDSDGDIVWWYNIGETTRARMSYDGNYMWIAKGNVPKNTAKMVRVSMDGLDEQDLTAQFQDLNHDFTVLPDETVIFIAYGSANGCDKVAERSPSGTTHTIVENICSLLGVSASHLNAIHYDQSDDTVIFSELDSSTYTKVDRSGNVQWILNGNQSTFSNNDYKWNANHGFHILPDNHILVFNNGSPGSGQASVAIELALDLTGGNTASRVWEYTSTSGIQNVVMGDAQRLSNGNTLVTYSTQGIVHEVDPNKNVVEEMSWGLGAALGYMMQRDSLYGPPPK